MRVDQDPDRRGLPPEIADHEEPVPAVELEAHQRPVERASRRGDQLDGLWDDAARSCVAKAARGGDRAWFAVYEPNGLQIQLSSGVDCEYWLSMLQNNANLVRNDMTRASEAARRQGVYPGVMRDIRRQYKMEGPGW